MLILGMRGIFAKRYSDVSFERTYLYPLTNKASEDKPIFATSFIGCVFLTDLTVFGGTGYSYTLVYYVQNIARFFIKLNC